MSLFPSIIFFVPFPLSLCVESTPYVLSLRMMVFFYDLVTTDWILDNSLCENQSINHSIIRNITILYLVKISTFFYVSNRSVGTFYRVILFSTCLCFSLRIFKIDVL